MSENKTMRILREANGFSQEYIAHELGINQNTYSRLESGQTRLTIDRIKKLAKLYKVAPEYFLSDKLPVINYNTGPYSHSNSGVIENYTNSDNHIIELYEKLLTDKDKMLAEKDEIIKLLKSELSNARKERDEILILLNKLSNKF